jgi:uncharacterized protein (TIGR03084 family)
MDALCDDLAAEHADLDRIVACADLAVATPADGWTVADQLGHLWYFDRQALLALTQPEAFSSGVVALLAALEAGGPDPGLDESRALDDDALLDAWRADRERLVDAARRVDPSERVPWYGPAMSARSFVTARLMETWAHGQDVVDALAADRPPTDRLRHVAHIGVGARRFSLAINGLPPNDAPVAVVLEGPSGDVWTWGPADDPSVDDRVEGTALDFCLVVTQRRHRDDTDLRVTGPNAVEWMHVAQAFAGGPGPGRAPGQFPRRPSLRGNLSRGGGRSGGSSR